MSIAITIDAGATSSSDGPTWTLPRGSGMLAIWWKHRLVIVDATTRPRHLIEIPEVVDRQETPLIRWSPDGNRLGVLTNTSLWLIGFTRGSARPTRRNVASDSQFAWSPSSHAVVITSRDGFTVVDNRNSLLQSYTNSTIALGDPRITMVWSRTGTRIIEAFGVRRNQTALEDDIVAVTFGEIDHHTREATLLKSARDEALAIALVVDRRKPTILFWPNMRFGADVNGGLPLDIVVGNSRYRLLKRTFPTGPWLSFSVDHRSLATIAGDRPDTESWRDKYLVACRISELRCARIPSSPLHTSPWRTFTSR